MTLAQTVISNSIMDKYDELFLKNVFPEDEQPLVDEAVDVLVDELVGFATLGHANFTRLNSL